ncbi:MAG: hypothetical protein HOL80_04340 [Candidatus Magasanikbacteria bacterium]|jgi:hypothetical protein|nr:hypothetical protein [Candidatus Magasanikbacteria bacterium]MBT5263091.1 hypothetical protein [Candidatus Magasanikbacteria bacterium]MBT5820396.1 hypothetical protein [Candidatus Magasanikbacteria bacterium]MBT6294590.1 hypothetical protein [Candidatus Magasanikbacteria bacterium]
MTKKTKKSIAKYEDVSGQFSNKTLFQSFWFVKHKLIIRKIGIALLGFGGASSVLFSVVVFGEYVLFGYWEDKAMYTAQVQEFPNFAQNKHVYAAKNITISPTRVFAESPEKYSIYTRIKNPNEQFVAEIFFHYDVQGKNTSSESILVMPQSDQFLAVRGVFSGARIRSPKLVIEHIRWKRISPHRIDNISAFVADRLQFHAGEFTVTPPKSVDDVGTAQAEIELFNDSVYSFNTPSFFVVLYRGRGVEYIHYTTQLDFLFGQKRILRFATLLPLSSITSIEIIPIIDVFNHDEYLSIDYEG